MTTELQQRGVVEGPGHLSFSQLSVYQSCGTKYELSYISKVPREPQGAFLGGIAVHHAIERSEIELLWKDDSNFDRADSVVTGYYLDELHRLVEANGGADAIRWGGRERQGAREDLAWWEKNGEFMLRRYRLTREAMEGNGWGNVAGGTEMKVVTPLDGVPIPVEGRIDAFLMHEGGEPLIVDWTTGSMPKSAFQFATYARLIQIARDIAVRRGVAIYLRRADAARQVQWVEFAEIVGRMDEVYAAAYEGIEHGNFVPNPSTFCSSCSVRAHCWYWTGTHPD